MMRDVSLGCKSAWIVSVESVRSVCMAAVWAKVVQCTLSSVTTELERE